MYGTLVDIKGKSIRMEVNGRRYWPMDDLFDETNFPNDNIAYCHAPYFIKDINIVVGNRIQVQALIDQYTTNPDTGTGFFGQNFNILATGTDNNLLELDPAIITNYTGSNSAGTNPGFQVYTGGPGGGSTVFTIDMDCEAEEEG